MTKMYHLSNGEIRKGYQLEDLEEKLQTRIIEEYRQTIEEADVDDESSITDYKPASREEVEEFIRINDFMFDENGEDLPIRKQTYENKVLKHTFGKHDIIKVVENKPNVQNDIVVLERKTFDLNKVVPAMQNIFRKMEAQKQAKKVKKESVKKTGWNISHKFPSYSKKNGGYEKTVSVAKNVSQESEARKIADGVAGKNLKYEMKISGKKTKYVAQWRTSFGIHTITIY